jgi:uroporphyrinogen-III synthase
LLVLRPEPGASATVQRARTLGLDAVAVPLFEIEPLPWEAPDPEGFDGLLVTSANAVRFAGEQIERLRQLRVYAVGQATADAAREAGFDIAASGVAGVEPLLDAIPTDLRLLHLCGVDRHAVQGAKQAITPVTVYRSIPIAAPDLSCAARSIALIHSPRAGRRFAELVGDRGSIAIAAISPAAGEAVGRGWLSVTAAERPNDDALLALAATLCNNSPPK